MSEYYHSSRRTWKEIHPGVFVSDLHRYPTGGGAALFRLEPGATLPNHNHPTGEHGYVIEGTGLFGGHSLSAGDALWMERNEEHEIRATTRLVFFATSLPKALHEVQHEV
jgi:quercetin dioxygenase-like cupin family protein